MSLPKQIQVAIFFWVSLIYILTLLRVAHLGLNAKFLLILQNKNGPSRTEGPFFNLHVVGSNNYQIP